jgi:nucleotide-binding universal stress UspA family protein
MPGIIVGVDGSDHSYRALVWAMHEAAQHTMPLTVMTVSPFPARPATMTLWGLPTLPEGGFNQEHARRAVQDAVDKAASENQRDHTAGHRECGYGAAGGGTRDGIPER